VNIFCVSRFVKRHFPSTDLCCAALRCAALTDWDPLLTLPPLPVTPVCRSAHPYSSISTIMSLTSNPLSSGGPSSVSASRTQNLKRSVQAAFEGKNYLHLLSFMLSLHEINPRVTRLIISFPSIHSTYLNDLEISIPLHDRGAITSHHRHHITMFPTRKSFPFHRRSFSIIHRCTDANLPP
jgi:hypothetical protein